MNGSFAITDAERTKDEQVRDRQKLYDYLMKHGGPHKCKDVSKALGFSHMRPAALKRLFPSYFVTWTEDLYKDRNTYIDLHHHLAARRTA